MRTPSVYCEGNCFKPIPIVLSVVAITLLVVGILAEAQVITGLQSQASYALIGAGALVIALLIGNVICSRKPDRAKVGKPDGYVETRAEGKVGKPDGYVETRAEEKKETFKAVGRQPQYIKIIENATNTLSKKYNILAIANIYESEQNPGKGKVCITLSGKFEQQFDCEDLGSVEKCIIVCGVMGEPRPQVDERLIDHLKEAIQKFNYVMGRKPTEVTTTQTSIIIKIPEKDTVLVDSSGKTAFQFVDEVLDTLNRCYIFI